MGNMRPHALFSLLARRKGHFDKDARAKIITSAAVSISDICDYYKQLKAIGAPSAFSARALLTCALLMCSPACGLLKLSSVRSICLLRAFLFSCGFSSRELSSRALPPCALPRVVSNVLSSRVAMCGLMARSLPQCVPGCLAENPGAGARASAASHADEGSRRPQEAFC